MFYPGPGTLNRVYQCEKSMLTRCSTRAVLGSPRATLALLGGLEFTPDGALPCREALGAWTGPPACVLRLPCGQLCELGQVTKLSGPSVFLIQNMWTITPAS